MRRISRILLWTAGVILTLVLLTGVVIETSFFKNWLRGVIVKQANEHINGTLAIGRFKGNLFTGVELDDVAVIMDGEPVVRIDAMKTSLQHSASWSRAGRSLTASRSCIRSSPHIAKATAGSSRVW